MGTSVCDGHNSGDKIGSGGWGDRNGVPGAFATTADLRENKMFDWVRTFEVGIWGVR